MTKKNIKILKSQSTIYNIYEKATWLIITLGLQGEQPLVNGTM